MEPTEEEFDAAVAGALEDTQSEPPEEEQDAEEESDEDTEDDDEGEEEPESDDDDDDSGDDDSGSDDSSLEDARAALEDGDLDALAKALGKPKGWTGAGHKEFQALRHKTNKQASQLKAEKSKHEAAKQADSELLTKRLAEAREEYGDPIRARKAWNMNTKAGAVEAGQYIQKMFGADLSEITLKIATGQGAVTPESKALKDAQDKLDQDRKEFDEHSKKQSQSATDARQREATIVQIHKGLKHAYVQTEDDARDVLDLLDKSWDSQTRAFSKTPKQCADELLERDTARAKRRGFIKSDAPAKKKKGRNPPPPKAVKSAKQRAKDAQSDFERNVALSMRDSHSS